jgi:hypothetical protein
MLEKNGYPVEMEKHRKEILKIVGRKKRVTFQLVNSLSRVDERGRRRYKRRHLIENVFVSNDDKGNTVEFRYYKNKREKGNNSYSNIAYTPEFTMFENEGKVDILLGDSQNQNLDLFWFLWNHNRKASNKNETGSKRALFYFVDENREALEFAQKMEADAEMRKLLWDKDSRLSNDELITIARALRVVGVDDMNIQRVQTEIQKKCQNNPHRFLNLQKSDKETEMKSKIQQACEAGILNFDKTKLQWYMTDGGNSAKLCPVRKTDDNVSALIYFLKNNDDNDHYGRILELVKELKVPALK